MPGAPAARELARTAADFQAKGVSRLLYKNEEAFHKAHKAGEAHGAYLLYGAENYLIERWAQRLCGAGDVFNLQRFDGKGLDMDALYEALEALPLMAREKCVLVNDLEWAKTPAGDQKKLAEMLADLPPDCRLVVTAKAPAFDAKSAGGKKLIALFDKAGCAVELGARPGSGQTAFLKAEAKKHGCTISGELCRYILETCEPDMLSLQNEMHKLCAYAGGGALTREQADAVCTPKIEARIFDLRGAILAGNVARALALLDTLFYLRESPVGILAVLSRGYVDLYRARVARDEGLTVPQAAERFGCKNREFIMRGAYSASAGLSATYLRKALDVLLGCDRALKSSPVDGRVLLEQAVFELFVLRAGAGHG